MHRPGYAAVGGQMIRTDDDDSNDAKPTICFDSLLSKVAMQSPPKLTIVDECSPQNVDDKRHLWRNGSKRLQERPVLQSKQVRSNNIAGV
ncbi:unnamed protein product [Strongylus vulgaris]|uniref:Uncharacterized protein n=1 Tax=Strongylus vulgaris TaxID=40348 RepID=A0A3P7I8L8_STRVU|nr:unnamed protein product [Strongylus vulgaris]